MDTANEFNYHPDENEQETNEIILKLIFAAQEIHGPVSVMFPHTEADRRRAQQTFNDAKAQLATRVIDQAQIHVLESWLTIQRSYDPQTCRPRDIVAWRAARDEASETRSLYKLPYSFDAFHAAQRLDPDYEPSPEEINMMRWNEFLKNMVNGPRIEHLNGENYGLYIVGQAQIDLVQAVVDTLPRMDYLLK